MDGGDVADGGHDKALGSSRGAAERARRTAALEIANALAEAKGENREAALDLAAYQMGRLVGHGHDIHAAGGALLASAGICGLVAAIGVDAVQSAMAGGISEGRRVAAEEIAAEARQNSDWRQGLIVNRRGQPKALLANAVLALREAPEWQGVIRLNQLKLAVEICAAPPWHQNGAWQQRNWTDSDDVRAAEWLQHAGIEVSHRIVGAAATEVAERHAYHPVRDYLNGLKWDGVARISYFARNILGAGEGTLNEAVSRAILIAAVARIMTPGCKVDTVPVLEGPQGKLKSTVVEMLFGAGWYSDDLADLGSKDSALQVARVWGVEVSELASLTRAEAERIKAFISRRVDQFRPPYGRAVAEWPRQSVLWGTTNLSEYLKDETGGRRYWPIACGALDLERLKADRDQIWAEAVYAWRSGEPWWLTDEPTRALARVAQEARQVSDAWEERIVDYVHNKEDVSVGEVLQFGLVLEPAKWGQADQNRVARYLRRQGWTRRLAGPKGRQKWRYFRPRAGPDPPVNQSELDYQ